ncbi:MAG: protein kinase [Kofleriaceae bacterium]|nr:protein kinase [Kofleriaceae bacterium]
MTGSADGAADSLIGTLVADRYMVEAHLGEGGMGSVYRARHVTLDKLVALKVLHAEFSRKEDFVRRFLLEAKAASRIRNQHVIDITDFGTTDEGYVFFSMEFLAGKDLHNLLGTTLADGGLLPWDRACGIFLQICEALSAAHDKGIIHRDLKPENVFLVDGTGKQDFVKLLDFGIAKVEQAEGEEDGERKLTKTGMLFGTPEYMAPEQARGEKPDHRVDVYAMGCLLFQFLTGNVPFTGESFMAILTQHMIEPVPAISAELLSLSGAPQGILEVIDKALAKDRDERYGSIAVLATAVANAGQAKTRMESAVTAEASRGDSGGARTGVGPSEGQARHVEAVAPLDTRAHDGPSGSKAKYAYGAIAALAIGVGAFIATSAGSSSSDEAQSGDAPATSSPAVPSSIVPAVPGNTVVQPGEKTKAPVLDVATETEVEAATEVLVEPALTETDPVEAIDSGKSGDRKKTGRKHSRTSKQDSKDSKKQGAEDAKKATSTVKKDPGGKVKIGDVDTISDFPSE